MAVLDIYTRVSRKSDARALSVRGQERRCRARVAEVGATVGEVFTDNGKSAWRRGVHRPDWEALMARLEAGESDGVCVYDLERFARQVIDGERLVKAAERGLLVLDSEGEYDLRKAGDKKNFRNAIVAAEYYSDLLRQKVPRGKRLRAMEGQPNASHRAFGFEPDGTTQRKSERDLLRGWADRLLNGESQATLISEATEAGILTSHGLPWNRTGLRAIMTNPRYAGWIVYKGEPVSELPGEPVFDRAVFKRLEALFAARRPGRPPSDRYMCTGKARCGACGHGLNGRPRHNKRPYDDGEICRDYWCCPTNGGCGQVSVDQRMLDEWASEWMIKTLADPKHADTLAKQEAELSAQRAELESEASAIEATLGDLNGKLAADLPAAIRAGRRETVLSRHAAVTGPLEERLGSIATELAALEAESAAPAPRRTIPPRAQRYLYWLDKWDSGSTGERRQILVQALNGRVLVVEPGSGGTERIKVRP